MKALYSKLNSLVPHQRSRVFLSLYCSLCVYIYMFINNVLLSNCKFDSFIKRIWFKRVKSKGFGLKRVVLEISQSQHKHLSDKVSPY